MKISFDFDATLSHPNVQALAKKFIASGHEVWITSSRPLRGNSTREIHKDLFDIAKSLGIENQVQLTNYEEKYNYVIDFDLHFDNSSMEVDLINAHSSKCIAMKYKNNTIKKSL